MRERTIALLALAGILAFGAAWAQDTAALVQAIQGEDASARMAAVAELEEMGAPAIGPLFGLIGGDDGVADRLARRAAQAITQQAAGAGDEAQRAPVAAALIAQTTSDRCLGARHWALRMLSFVGGDGDVPALARLLQDDDVREMARYALVRIPGEASLAALSGAASVETDPAFKAALITSLGSRGDPAGLPVVREALKDRTRPVRAAAIDALARIPDPASEQALREALSGGRAEERAQACSAYLRLAETLLSAGHTKVAEQMYQRMYDDAPTEPARYAGLVGLARSQGSRALPTLLAALDSDDAKIGATARTALVDTDGLTRAIGEVVVRPPSREARLMLIGVLTARGDPAAIPALLQVAGIEDEETQIAAFEALGKLRRSAAATTLLLALDRSEQGPVRDAAVAALSKIPGPVTTQAIARMLATAPSPELRIALAQVLGRRPHPSARTALLAATTDADEAVQAAALEALGQCGDPAATPTLLAMLRMAEGDVRNAAESALEKMPAAESREAMVAALPGAPDDMRATLLRLLGRDPDGSLASTFTRAARDDDEAVAVAAIEALGKLQDASSGPLLLDIAENGTEKTKGAAVRAYLQIADARRDEDGEAALAIYRRALELATSDDERRIAIRGIGAVGDSEALPLLRPFLEGGRLQAAAVAAVMPIADKLEREGKRDEAIELYTKAVELSTDRKVIVDAAGKLRKLGVEVDIAAKAGFVGHWWVLGPFPGRKKLMETDLIATDAAVDPAAEMRVADETHKWKYVPVDDPQGMLDMEKKVARKTDCGAYAYAEVTSEAARDVLFKIGSDDAIFCWLNGELVHKFLGDRGYSADQDTAQARLKAGTNTILMKVINNGGPWALGLRITDRDGKPLQLEQRKP